MGLLDFQLSGAGQSGGLHLGLASGPLLLAEGLQLLGSQDGFLPLGGGGVLQRAAHRAGLPLPQAMGQVQGGVFPQQGFLALQPLGERLQQELLLFFPPLCGSPGGPGLLLPLLPAGELVPGSGELFQGLAALQQGGKPRGGLLTGL